MITDEPLPTRASLLERLKHSGDHESWEEFHRMYRGLLLGVTRGAGLNEHEAEEAVQDTLIAVLRKMPAFRYEPGRDSFKGWLLQIVRWKILDQVRRRPRAAPAVVGREPASMAEQSTIAEGWEQDSVVAPASVADLRETFAAIWDAEWKRHVLTRALARVKRQAKPEHYAIYHLYVIEDRPLAEVRRTLGVSAAAIYLAKHRVGALVKKETLRLSQQEH